LVDVHYYGEHAVQAALILHMLKANEEPKAVQVLEQSLERAVDGYYQHIDKNDLSSKQSRAPEAMFEILAGFPELAASYVQKHVSSEKIAQSKGFQRLLRDYAESN